MLVSIYLEIKGCILESGVGQNSNKQGVCIINATIS